MTDVPPRRRARLVAMSMGALFAALLVWAVVRGTWATRKLHNPATPEAGAVTQLALGDDGRKHVRCARVVNAPLERVWATVTGYDRFTQLFPRLTNAAAAPQPDGRTRLGGTVDGSVFGTFTFSVDVRHERSAAGAEASWDQPGGSLTVNRGRWRLTPLEGGRTLLVYELEAELDSVPSFIVRLALMTYLPDIVRAVAEDAERPAP